VLLVNAQHLQAVPGRKTDVSDAEWIADLLRQGLLRASFIPPVEQRDLRELTRHRSNFIRERTNLIHRVQKTLEGANLKLASVASDSMGVSGRAILTALIEGHTAPQTMAELSKGRLRRTRDQLTKALEGRVKPHHRLVLTELLCQMDSVDETIARFDDEIEKYGAPCAQAVVLLDTIPGIARATAELIVSEIGTERSRFPSARHLAAWAGLAPGNRESGGKRDARKKRKGHRALCTGRVQAAQVVARSKGNYWAAPYHRLAPRRGKQKALIAVAHSILVICYHMLQRHEPYQDLGANYFDQQSPEATAKRLKHRLEKLGYQVLLNAPPIHVPR
jgi:transposase